MKKILIPVTFLSVLLFACNNEEEMTPSPALDETPAVQQTVPVVQQEATYGVIVESDIVYAEGLSHETTNSTSATTMPLLLDVYLPDNDLTNRPVFLFIHGGAFANGSRKQWAIVNIANFYAARGWVFISIDYRLLSDQGTVPTEWADFAASIPADVAGTFRAMYPAQRDAKAAMRWMVAHKDQYHINTDYITVGGASAGANTAKGISVSDPQDFTNEISTDQDPTLLTTHLDQTYEVQTIVDFWGGPSVTMAFEEVYGKMLYDPSDPPLMKAHGTADPTVPYQFALDLQDTYDVIGVEMLLHTLEGVGHGDFSATLDGQKLEELAFDFIVAQQELVVE